MGYKTLHMLQAPIMKFGRENQTKIKPNLVSESYGKKKNLNK